MWKSIRGLRNCLGRGNLSRFLGDCGEGLQENLVFLEGFSENISKVIDVVRIFIPSFELQ